MVITEEIKEL